MNRFIIADGLPYLLHAGKTYAVRWDDNGFTVGAEVQVASASSPVYSDISIFAKCSCLDSIGAGKGPEENQEPVKKVGRKRTAKE